MKKTLLMSVFAAALALQALPANAWKLWDDFKASNIETARVVDYSDSRRITTSEGQSYALFFALVANDRTAFAALSDWTEKNLSAGDITKALPSWLWGQTRAGDRNAWGVIDTNNAADSDMWIAWCYLEAGRLWNKSEYTAKGRAMLELLKKEVRDVENLRKVILPGRVGFEDKNGTVKLNPSYYPLFILRRFALEDACLRRLPQDASALRPVGLRSRMGALHEPGTARDARCDGLHGRELQRHPHLHVGRHDVA